MQIRLTQQVAEIPLGRDEWNALVSHMCAGTVFQTYEWFHSWWEVFGFRHTLYFLTIHSGAQIVGFAPFVMHHDEGGVRELRIAGSTQADYVDVVICAQHQVEGLHAVLQYLEQNADLWDRIYLRNIPAESVTARTIEQQGRSLGLGVIRWGRSRCYAMRIEGREEQIGALLAKYSMRRAPKWFSSRGRVEFKMVADGSEVNRHLPRFFDQHIARWRGTRTPSRFLDPMQRRFFELLAQKLGAAGWLSFAVLEFEGEMLAAHFGFVFARRLIWYKPTFDPAFRKHSPGLVLIRRLVEYARDQRCLEVDFTIGDEAFKGRFATETSLNLDFALYGRRFAHYSGLMRFSVGRIISRALRYAGVRPDG